MILTASLVLASFLLFRPPGQLEFRLELASPPQGSALALPRADDHSGFGRSICFCGDLDGDKCSEIAVGSRSAGDKHQGKVLVYSGKSGKLLREIQGDVEGSGFGTEVCDAGDQDGDGLREIAVAAPMGRRVRGSGSVEIRSGKDGSRLHALAGAEDENYFGTNLVAIGDVDGDKKDELLVRMRFGRGPKEQERFTVVSPASGKRLFTIDAPEGSRCRENGVPVAALGDVDGDKLPDFAIEHGAQVFVHSGKDGKQLLALGAVPAPGTVDSFGTAICALGDYSEDGRPDVFVGAPTAPDGAVRLYRGMDGREAPVRVGTKYPSVGFSLARGAARGNDLPDLVASACSRSGGQIVVQSGESESIQWVVDVESSVSDTPIGWRVAGGSDADGDGVADFMASRWWPTSSKGAAVLVFSGKDRARIHEIVPGP